MQITLVLPTSEDPESLFEKKAPTLLLPIQNKKNLIDSATKTLGR